MIDRKLIKAKIQFPKLKTKEDFLLWINIVRSGDCIYGLNKFLTDWTKTHGSLSSSIFQKLTDSFRLYNEYLSFGFLKSIFFVIILSVNFLKKKYD